MLDDLPAPAPIKKPGDPGFFIFLKNSVLEN
jgi:hypothetical protein